VRLDSVATLSRPEVQKLLDAAEAQAEPPFPIAGSGKLIIRSISEKQRLRTAVRFFLMRLGLLACSARSLADNGDCVIHH
jgi:hypothetical protein